MVEQKKSRHCTLGALTLTNKKVVGLERVILRRALFLCYRQSTAHYSQDEACEKAAAR
jgi:hypothetical protein